MTVQPSALRPDEPFPELVRKEIGPNKAHAQFCRHLSTLKVLAYLLFSNREQLCSRVRTLFEDALGQAKKERGPDTTDFGLGVVTKGISRTQFQAHYVTRIELELFLNDEAGTLFHIYGKLYTDIHRVFVEFLLNLFDEIALADPRVLTPYAERKLSFYDALEADTALQAVVRSMRDSLSQGPLSVREKAYEKLGLPLHCDESLMSRLRTIEATRNVLEHNDGRVDKRFIARTGAVLPVGMCVQLDPEVIALAFGAVETIGDDLNRRAVKKFGLRVGS